MLDTPELPSPEIPPESPLEGLPGKQQTQEQSREEKSEGQGPKSEPLRQKTLGFNLEDIEAEMWGVTDAPLAERNARSEEQSADYCGQAYEAAKEGNFEKAREAVSLIKDPKERAIWNSLVSKKMAENGHFEEALRTIRGNERPASKTLTLLDIAEYQSKAGLEKESARTLGEALDAAKDMADPVEQQEWINIVGRDSAKLEFPDVAEAAALLIKDRSEKALLYFQLSETTDNPAMYQKAVEAARSFDVNVYLDNLAKDYGAEGFVMRDKGSSSGITKATFAQALSEEVWVKHRSELLNMVRMVDVAQDDPYTSNEQRSVEYFRIGRNLVALDDRRNGEIVLDKAIKTAREIEDQQKAKKLSFLLETLKDSLLTPKSGEKA